MLESRRLGSLRDETLELKRDLVRLEDELDRLRAAARRSGIDPASLAPARTLIESGRARVLSHLLTVEGAIRRGEETSTQLYHEVLSSRMRPFADATASLSRTVRDLARQLGKDARLEIVGEQVPVDRDVLVRLDAPLNHMLRNALDHGVETPDERRAKGKPAQATLRVEARHHAGMLRIRVSDDGRGIDLDALERKRRPLCLHCLDWSERRHHLAGGLGAAILERSIALGWIKRGEGRTLIVTLSGRSAFRNAFA
jgi:two-component system sensor histidine kinase and response regulator WspE